MEDDDVTGLLPIPATQAHLGCGGHQPLSPHLLLEAALTLAPGFPPDPWAASSRPLPGLEEGRVMVPSCNSSSGHRMKPSGWKCFYYSFGQTGRGLPGFRECWEAIQPHPTPPPGEATPEQKGSATAGTCPQPGAVNSPIVQIYRAGQSTLPASRGPGQGAMGPALRRAGRRVKLRPERC